MPAAQSKNGQLPLADVLVSLKAELKWQDSLDTDASPSTTSTSAASVSVSAESESLLPERPRLILVPGSLGLSVRGSRPAQIDILQPGSAAATAGVRRRDWLLAVNGRSVIELGRSALSRVLEECGDGPTELYVLQGTPRYIFPRTRPGQSQVVSQPSLAVDIPMHMSEIIAIAENDDKAKEAEVTAADEATGDHNNSYDNYDTFGFEIEAAPEETCVACALRASQATSPTVAPPLGAEMLMPAPFHPRRTYCLGPCTTSLADKPSIVLSDAQCRKWHEFLGDLVISIGAKVFVLKEEEEEEYKNGGCTATATATTSSTAKTKQVVAAPDETGVETSVSTTASASSSSSSAAAAAACTSSPFSLCFDLDLRPDVGLPRGDDMNAMLVHGVPHQLRRQVWLRASGALVRRAQCPLRYDQIAVCAAEPSLVEPEVLAQISKDLLRTFPGNVLFESAERPGTVRLRRVLGSLAWWRADIGYCQGMGMLTGILLLVLEEEEAFWVLEALTSCRLPVDYYTKNLMGIMTDQEVLKCLVQTNLPRLHRRLEECRIELSLITVNWFVTAFSSVAPPATTMRIWDWYLHHGSMVLFMVALAMLTLRLDVILALDDSSAIFNALADTPASMTNADRLLPLAFSFIHIETEVDVLRQRFRAQYEQQYAAFMQRKLERQRSSSSVSEKSEGAAGSRSSTPLSKDEYTDGSSGLSSPKPKRSWWNRLANFGLGADIDAAAATTTTTTTTAAAALEIMGSSSSGSGRRSRNGSGDVAFGNDKKVVPRNVAQTQKLMDISDAVADVIDFLQFSAPQIKGVSAVLSPIKPSPPAALLFSGDGKFADTPSQDGNSAVVPDATATAAAVSSEIVRVTGDDRVLPQLDALVRDRLTRAIMCVLEDGLLPGRDVWSFLTAATLEGGITASPRPTRRAAAFFAGMGGGSSSGAGPITAAYAKLSEREIRVHSAMEASLVATAHFFPAHEDPPPDPLARLASFVCAGLNLQDLADWMGLLPRAAGSRWYHPTAFVRNAAWYQVVAELRKLSSFHFHLRQALGK